MRYLANKPGYGTTTTTTKNNKKNKNKKNKEAKTIDLHLHADLIIVLPVIITSRLLATGYLTCVGRDDEVVKFIGAGVDGVFRW